MKPVSLFAILVATSGVITVYSQTPKPKQCKGVDIKVSEDKMNSMMECIKEGGFENFKDITPQRLPCILTCVMKKRQVIDGSGVLRKENVQELVYEDLAEEVKQDLNARITACFDQHGSKFNTDNANCVSTELVGCINMSYAMACKS